MRKVEFEKIEIGMELPSIIKEVTQEKINQYADAATDYNPIHVDEAFASQTKFGGTIAHGMLILAYVSEMMTLAFKESWFSGGKLAVRFKSPARSKDTVTVTGKVSAVEKDNDNLNFTCDIRCHNQNQEIIVTGEAAVRISLNN